MVIEVAGLVKRFGRVVALDHVNLEVEKGEVFGLLGRNGAGKTTLVKILLSIVFGSEGEARLLGNPVGDAAALRRVGYLPEDHQLPGYHSAASLLTFFGALQGLDRATCKRNAAGLLDRLEMTRWGKAKIRTFSKGMRQRLGLAQALVHRPEVVFLDEPTDGVDPVGRAEIRDLLLELKAEGVTIFLNSHLLSEIEMICDRVAIMNDGQIQRIGTVDDLTSTDQQFTFRVEGSLADVGARIEAIATRFAPTDGGFSVHVEDAADVDRVIDVLRAGGIGIRGITANRQSLEDVFLDVVREGATGGRQG